MILIAFRLGYIPLWFDDPAYIIEWEREKFVGFAACQCSNCLPAKGLALLNNLVFADQNNFDQIVTDDFQPPFIVDLKHKYPVKRAGTRKRKFNDMDRASLDVFREELVDKLAEFYDKQEKLGAMSRSSSKVSVKLCLKIFFFNPPPTLDFSTGLTNTNSSSASFSGSFLLFFSRSFGALFSGFFRDSSTIYRSPSSVLTSSDIPSTQAPG
ncbi:hypothetical protein PSTT_05774 [Puccinia striiformis]|uniref:Uncharacterized protein n=1 Tax=Puccinia striiformis TaxID=27350 RepID=A0A2S4VMQ9_9BASI|nr:hypothetical protein PSTT_05774 [Puccinia striiformis]